MSQRANMGELGVLTHTLCVNGALQKGLALIFVELTERPKIVLGFFFKRCNSEFSMELQWFQHKSELNSHKGAHRCSCHRVAVKKREPTRLSLSKAAAF